MEKSKDIFIIFYFLNQNQMQKINNNDSNNNDDNNKFDDEGSYGKMSTVLTDNADSRYISEDPMNVHGFTSDLSVIKEVRTIFLML